MTTTTAASVDSAQLEQAQKMREAGMITQKEYDRILERSQPQTTTVTTGGGGGASIRQLSRLKLLKYLLKWQHLQS